MTSSLEVTKATQPRLVSWSDDHGWGMTDSRTRNMLNHTDDFKYPPTVAGGRASPRRGPRMPDGATHLASVAGCTSSPYRTPASLGRDPQLKRLLERRRLLADVRS